VRRVETKAKTKAVARLFLIPESLLMNFSRGARRASIGQIPTGSLLRSEPRAAHRSGSTWHCNATSARLQRRLESRARRSVGTPSGDHWRRSWLQRGERKLVQELLRDASSSVTLELCVQGDIDAKNAPRKVMYLGLLLLGEKAS
jgi:hypothetical protein